MILDRNIYVAVWNHLIYSTYMDAANAASSLGEKYDCIAQQDD